MGSDEPTTRPRLDGRSIPIYGAVLLAQASSAAALPILPELQSAFGISAVMVALTTTTWGLARLLTDLPGGVLTERIRPARMLVSGALLAAVGSLGSALAPTFIVLLVGQAVAGVGSALMAVAAVISLMAATDPRHRGRTLGLYNASLQAGSTLSPAVAGIASAVWGWQAAFMVAAGLSLSGALFFVVSEGRAASGRPPAAAASAAGRSSPVGDRAESSGDPVRPSRSLVAAVDGSTFALFFVTGAAVQTAVPLFAGTAIGLGPAVIGMVLGFATLLRFAISLVGSELSDRYGRRRILVPGLLSCAVALVAFPAVDALAGFVLVTSLLAMGRVGNGVPLALLGDHLGVAGLGRAVGRNRFVADLALVIGPLAAGLLIERAGFAVAFPAIAVVVLAAVAIVGIQWATSRSADDPPGNGARRDTIVDSDRELASRTRTDERR